MIKIEQDEIQMYKEHIRELLKIHGLNNVINKDIHETDSVQLIELVDRWVERSYTVSR